MLKAGKRTVVCRKKLSHNWLESQYFKAVLVNDLQIIHRFFLSAEGGVGSGFKGIKMEERAAQSKNKELSAIVKKKESLIAESLLLLIQPLDFISNKILRVHDIAMTADFLSLLEAALPSIYRLLKLLFLLANFHKTSNPALCRQKKFVCCLKLSH